MHPFDPYGPGRARTPRTVPVEVARAWMERAEAAWREAERLRRRAEAAERAVAEREAELARVRDEVQALRQRATARSAATSPVDAAPAPLEQQLHRAGAEIVALRRQLARAQAAQEAEPEPAGDADPRLARLAADLANVRRHRDAEIERARREGRAEGLVALADAADDLRRALEATPERSGPWHDGLRQLVDRLHARLAAAGAQVSGAVGERFDPARHEAIGVAPGEPDTVVRVERIGLVAPDGTLLRPASVVVGASAGAGA